MTATTSEDGDVDRPAPFDTRVIDKPVETDDLDLGDDVDRVVIQLAATVYRVAELLEILQEADPDIGISPTARGHVYRSALTRAFVTGREVLKVHETGHGYRPLEEFDDRAVERLLADVAPVAHHVGVDLTPAAVRAAAGGPTNG
jgi:hypothetical protein